MMSITSEAGFDMSWCNTHTQQTHSIGYKWNISFTTIIYHHYTLHLGFFTTVIHSRFRTDSCTNYCSFNPLFLSLPEFNSYVGQKKFRSVTKNFGLRQASLIRRSVRKKKFFWNKTESQTPSVFGVIRSLTFHSLGSDTMVLEHHR